MLKFTNMPSVTVTIKSYIGCDSGSDGEEGLLLKLANVPSVTVAMKCYRERDLGNDWDDSSDDKLPWA